MKTLQVIMAHADSQETFDRHLQYWQRNGGLGYVMCPADSIVRTSYPVIAVGTKSHNGAMANHRFKTFFSVVSEMTLYDRLVVNEYDSLCLSFDLPDLPNDRIWGNVWENTQPEWFRGSHYFHPPLVMPMDIAARLALQMQTMPDDAERGFWDRLIGLAIDQAGVKWGSYDHLGFSRNTIEPCFVPAAVEARKKGAVMYHGVKTDQVLRALTSV